MFIFFGYLTTILNSNVRIIIKFRLNSWVRTWVINGLNIILESQRLVKNFSINIKPAVEGDGGAISLKSFNEGVVTVIMQGSCSGCPSSTMTLKAGIEGLLKRLIPEVQTVIAEEA